MKRHISKKAEAPGHLRRAAGLLAEAMELLRRAEMELELAGWRGAAHGVHQAGLRVHSWRGKMYDELDAVRKGEI